MIWLLFIVLEVTARLHIDSRVGMQTRGKLSHDQERKSRLVVTTLGRERAGTKPAMCPYSTTRKGTKSMGNDRVHLTWQPLVGETASQLIAESDEPFGVTVQYGPGDVEQVSSLHDGLMYFVSVDVPATAQVEVQA
jgi:hypothetical protein